MASSIDASGLIPPQIATQIISVAETQSGVLQLARKVPMPTGVSQMPVQTSVPTAGWLTAPGERKPFTDLGFGMESMTAEELAAVVAIPQVYLEDTSINLWNFVKPQLASAFAIALDNAVFFGTAAPSTFPAGGIVSATYSQTPSLTGQDPLAAVNTLMGAVEGQGLPVTGHDADQAVKSLLRGVRDNNGAFLLGAAQAGQDSVQNLYGVPIHFGTYPVGAPANFITGDWDALIIGVRQDIRYDIDSSGVIADAAGVVLISAFQDDVVLMRAYARYGCVVIKPPTQKIVGGGKPFAHGTLAALVPVGGAAQSADEGQAKASETKSK